MTDLDDAVRDIARLEASPGFAAGVRACLDADGTSRAPMWPRLAAGAIGLAAIGVTLWIATAGPEAPVAEIASQSSPAIEAPPHAAGVQGAPQDATSSFRPSLQTVSRMVPRRERRTATRPGRDHERALAALAAPEALDLPGIEPPPIDLSEMAIPSLDRPATLSVLDIPAGGAGIGERR